MLFLHFHKNADGLTVGRPSGKKLKKKHRIQRQKEYGVKKRGKVKNRIEKAKKFKTKKTERASTNDAY